MPPDDPTWICADCAVAAGKPRPRTSLQGSETGCCDLCNQIKTVSHPESYGGFSRVQLAIARSMVGNDALGNECAKKETRKIGFSKS